MNWFVLVKGELFWLGRFSDWNAAHDAANEHLGEAAWDWLADETDVQQWADCLRGGEAMNTDERFDLLSSVDWSIRRVKELHQTTVLDLQKAMAQKDRAGEGYLRGKEVGLDLALMHLEAVQHSIKAGV